MTHSAGSVSPEIRYADERERLRKRHLGGALEAANAAVIATSCALDYARALSDPGQGDIYWAHDHALQVVQRLNAASERGDGDA